MRYMRFVLAVALLIAVMVPSGPAAKQPPTEWKIELMFCTPWTGCAIRWFWYEEVEVVAPYGHLEVDHSGWWGGGFGDDGMLIEPQPPPNPEPLSEGGSDECGNADLNALLQEYRDYGVSGLWACNTFVQAGPGRFNRPEDNSHTWAVQPSITPAKVAEIESAVGHGIYISSSYRCPHRNADVGGVPQSRHVHGTAADMYKSSNGHNEEEFNILRTAAAATSPDFLTTWETYSDRHLHAHWGVAA